MKQSEKFIPIALTLIIGIVMQLLFIVSDSKDTPARAVVRFAKAYFKADPALADYVCEESLTSDDEDLVDQYLAARRGEAEARGLGMFYLRNKLYNVRTHHVASSAEGVEIRLTADLKPPLKAFFTKEESRPFDHRFKLINDGGTWKVCGNVFEELAQAL